MEEGASHDRRQSEGDACSDGQEGSAAVGVDHDYRRLIEEQRFELQELKRAAREASPTSNSRYPSLDERAVRPPSVAADGGPQHPLPPSPPPSRRQTPHVGGRQERYAGVGVGADFLAAVTRGRTPKTSGGKVVGEGGGGGVGIGVGARGGDGGTQGHPDVMLTIGAGGGGGHRTGAEHGGSTHPPGGVVVAAAAKLGSRAQGTSGAGGRQRLGGAEHSSSSWWQDDRQQPEPLLSTRPDAFPPGKAAREPREQKPRATLDTRADNYKDDTSSAAMAVRFSRGGETEAGPSASPNRLSAALGASAIADEALASLRGDTDNCSASGGPHPITYEADAVNGKVGASGSIGFERGLRAPYYSSPMGVDGIRSATSRADCSGGVGVTPDDSVGEIIQSSSSPPPPPPPLKSPAAVEQQPHPAHASRSPTARHTTEGLAGAAGLNGRVGTKHPHRGADDGPAGAGIPGLADHGSAGNRALGPAPRRYVGSSWGAGRGVWGASGGSGFLEHGDSVVAGSGGRGGGGGQPFRSASWAEKLVTKREEQSVLVRQLERELASTVSALRDERRERRGQTEALRSKLDKSRGTVRDMETELERRERMATTLMGELEALRLRCDRLSASREERAQEADKNMARLREDNRELEARLRQADAAAAEARAARAGADAERIRVEREAQAALEEVASTERRAREEAEAAASAADDMARELREASEGHERLRSELEMLQRRVEEEEAGDASGALRAQVADLERLLAAANQRCIALEARLALLERELVEAEGGEVEARARLRWALGKLGIDSAADNVAAAAAAAAAAAVAAGEELGPAPASPDKKEDLIGLVRTGLSGPRVFCRPEHTSPSAAERGEETEEEKYAGEGREQEHGDYDDEEGDEEEEAEKEYREPNWRSMVPALFPPGWRDREIAAAAARMGDSATRDEGFVDPVTADDAPPPPPAAAVAVAVVAAENETATVTAAPGSLQRSAGAPHKTIDARGARERTSAQSSGEWSGDGAYLFEEEEEDGGVTGGSERDSGGSDVTFNEAAERRARLQWGGGGGGGGGATSPVGRVDLGAPITSDRVRSALDHLTAEERSFAYAGGVETEYGHRPLGEVPLTEEQEHETLETQGHAGGGGADKDGLHVPKRQGRAIALPDGSLSSISRRRMTGTSRGRTGAGAAGPIAAASKRPSIGRERETAAGFGRCPLDFAVQAPARRRHPGSAAASSPRGSSTGRSGQRLRVRVPIPRAASGTRDPGTRRGRPPSRPGATTAAANPGALSQPRAAAASLLSSTAPSRIKPGLSGGISVAGVTLKRSRRQSQSPPLPNSRHHGQPAAATLPAGGSRRRAAAVLRRSDGSAGGYLDTDISLGSATPKPQRTRRTPPESGSSRTGAGQLGSSGSRNADPDLGRSGTAGRRDEGRSAETRRPRSTSSRQVPGGPSKGAGGGGAREHVSLMRRRREKGVMRSRFASSRTVGGGGGGGGGGGRRSARVGGGLSAGAGNTSTCSSNKSRAWRP